MVGFQVELDGGRPRGRGSGTLRALGISPWDSGTAAGTAARERVTVGAVARGSGLGLWKVVLRNCAADSAVG